MSTNLIIALCLIIIGFLYASVCHGGASGYLAVLSIFGIQVTVSPFYIGFKRGGCEFKFFAILQNWFFL